MKILITESGIKNIMRDFDESLRFYKDGTFRWIDDKNDTGMYTSMVKKDNDKVQFTANTTLLPKSQVIAHNLYDIKNFQVTKALKHGQRLIYLKNTDTEKEKKSRQVPVNLKHHKSIDEFKEYVGKYIIRYLSHIQKDIDVVLTPESSSNFNTQIADVIKRLYKEYFKKDIRVENQAFVKTPETAKIDMEYGKEYMKQDIEKLYKDAPEDKIEKILQKSINDVYKIVATWQTEGKIKRYVDMVYNLIEQQKEIRKGRKGKIPTCKQKRIDDIQKEIDLILNLLGQNTEKDILPDTKYFRKGHTQNTILRDIPRKFEIKNLPDGIRKSLYRLYSLSQDVDSCYSYTNKSGETISGKTEFLTWAIQKNKTILIFDDNLSSGRTMDDSALYLIEKGVKKENIVVITFGSVPASSYSKFSQYYKL